MILDSLSAALQTRLSMNTKLGDRSHYIGASEIGQCLRKVVLSKLHPEPFDMASMGRMLAGKAMENEIVQLVRIALNSRLRNTGRSQLDLRHARLPFHAHPDGIIRGGLDDLEGDGILEVKTASTVAFKRYKDEGLPPQYLDQVQAQMGLSGLMWALVVLASRENLAEIETYTVRFDPEHYAQLEGRAARVAAVLENNNIPNELNGEPDLGYCHSCPYASSCDAFQARREAGARGEVAEVVRLQLEAQLEELALVELISEPAQERIAEIRGVIKETLLNSGADKVQLSNGIVQIVESSRSSFDSKALQRESPELFTRFQKTSFYSNLRITHKGDKQCLPMAS